LQRRRRQGAGSIAGRARSGSIAQANREDDQKVWIVRRWSPALPVPRAMFKRLSHIGVRIT